MPDIILYMVYQILILYLHYTSEKLTFQALALSEQNQNTAIALTMLKAWNIGSASQTCQRWPVISSHNDNKDVLS